MSNNSSLNKRIAFSEGKFKPNHRKHQLIQLMSRKTEVEFEIDLTQINGQGSTYGSIPLPLKSLKCLDLFFAMKPSNVKDTAWLRSLVAASAIGHYRLADAYSHALVSSNEIAKQHINTVVDRQYQLVKEVYGKIGTKMKIEITGNLNTMSMCFDSKHFNSCGAIGRQKFNIANLYISNPNFFCICTRDAIGLVDNRMICELKLKSTGKLLHGKPCSVDSEFRAEIKCYSYYGSQPYKSLFLKFLEETLKNVILDTNTQINFRSDYGKNPKFASNNKLRNIVSGHCECNDESLL